MSQEQSSKGTYQTIAANYPEIIDSLARLGKTVRGSGPLDEKTTHLVQGIKNRGVR